MPDRETAEYTVRLRVNGRESQVLAEPRTLLSELLRKGLGLTGTHVGCDTSQCGACTVLLDGRAVKSCTVLAVQTDGAEVVTVEGLRDLVPESARIDGLHPLQAAFWTHHGLQCGFCTPGILMAGADLLAQRPHPTDKDIERALEGHICRCTGYQNIKRALAAAAHALTETAYAPATASASKAGGDA